MGRDEVYFGELLSRGVPLGRLMLRVDDPSMGGMLSQLIPAAAYRTIQGVVVGQRNVSGHPGLDLRVRLENGTILMPAGGISVFDADDEMGEISVSLAGVDPAQLVGSGRDRSFYSAMWSDDGSRWWFEVIDDTVTRQVVESTHSMKGSHRFNLPECRPLLADQPFSSFAAELMASDGREVTAAAFNAVWAKLLKLDDQEREESFSEGRAKRRLLATAREFRFHPFYGEQVVLSLGDTQEVVCLMPRSDYPSDLPGMTLEVTVVAVDLALGGLMVSPARATTTGS